MKTSLLVTLCLAVATISLLPSPAVADTAEAMCEFRKGGETRQGRSGPCDFSQRQGYVSINLRNGDRWELSPGDKPNHYRDQKGNKVVLTVQGGANEYKWDNKKIIVTFDSGGASHGAGMHEGPDRFQTVCGVIVGGQNYRYRCEVTDHYWNGQKTHTTLRFPDQTLDLLWRGGDRVELRFEGMVPQDARYSSYEGETNFRFEDKTYFYISNKDMARREVRDFRD